MNKTIKVKHRLKCNGFFGATEALVITDGYYSGCNNENLQRLVTEIEFEYKSNNRLRGQLESTIVAEHLLKELSLTYISVEINDVITELNTSVALD